MQTHAVVNLYQVVHFFVLTDCSLSFSKIKPMLCNDIKANSPQGLTLPKKVKINFLKINVSEHLH